MEWHQRGALCFFHKEGGEREGGDGRHPEILSVGNTQLPALSTFPRAITEYLPGKCPRVLHTGLIFTLVTCLVTRIMFGDKNWGHSSSGVIEREAQGSLKERAQDDPKSHRQWSDCNKMVFSGHSKTVAPVNLTTVETVHKSCIRSVGPDQLLEQARCGPTS